MDAGGVDVTGGGGGGGGSSSSRGKSNGGSAACTPYELLNVPRDATQGQIRKAFLMLARKVHPDKNPGNKNAGENFAALERAYAILKDPDKRKLYDRTGCTDQQDSESFWEAYQQYRAVFPEVTKEDYEAYISSYKGSPQEFSDLRHFYEDHNGDVTNILEWIIASANEDIDRFVAFFESEISSGKLQRTSLFDDSKTRIVKIGDNEDDCGENLDDTKEDDVEADDLLALDDYDDDDGIEGFIVHDIEPEEDSMPEVTKKKRKQPHKEDAVAPSNKKGKTKKKKRKKATTTKKNKKTKESELDSIAALRAQLLQRASSRHSAMVNELAAKYA